MATFGVNNNLGLNSSRETSASKQKDLLSEFGDILMRGKENSGGGRLYNIGKIIAKIIAMG